MLRLKVAIATILILVGLIADEIVSSPVPLESLSEIPRAEWHGILESYSNNELNAGSFIVNGEPYD